MSGPGDSLVSLMSTKFCERVVIVQGAWFFRILSKNIQEFMMIVVPGARYLLTAFLKAVSVLRSSAEVASSRIMISGLRIRALAMESLCF